MVTGDTARRFGMAAGLACNENWRWIIVDFGFVISAVTIEPGVITVARSAPLFLTKPSLRCSGAFPCHTYVI